MNRGRFYRLILHNIIGNGYLKKEMLAVMSIHKLLLYTKGKYTYGTKMFMLVQRR